MPRLVAPTGVAMELLDAAALLWRLHLRGVDVGNRWADIADAYEPTLSDGYYPFNDMHAAMAFVATGRWDLVASLLRTLRARAGDTDSGGLLIRDVGLPVVRAIEAFGRGDYATAVSILRPVRLIANRFGGSHAQRDIVHRTLIGAALRAGDGALSRALTAERTAQKPHCPFSWRLRSAAEAM